MATYYVRRTGSDSNAGTSAGAAWATLGKALGASGIASGDTVYVGAGIYREAVTVNMTSATSETKIIGDVDGSHTGDPGVVRWTGFTTDGRAATSSGAPLTLNGKDYLTFQNIEIDGGANGQAIAATTLTSLHITFTNCTIITFGSFGANTNSVRLDQAAAWLFDSCTFVSFCGVALLIQLDLAASADYSAGVTIQNCLFLCFAALPCIRIASGGSGSFKGGGVTIYNCTLHTAGASSGGCIETNSANISTTFPINVYNCIITCANRGISANTSGQIVEDYNFINAATALTNVTAGAHSRSSTSVGPFEWVPELGQSERAGMQRRPWFEPSDLSPVLGWGNQSGSPSTDSLGRPRPSGGCKVFDSGTATSGGSATLTDTNKAWKVNAWAGYTLKVTGGTGSGQTKHIVSNTATAITVSGNWGTNPDSTSAYEIYDGAPSTSGKATAGAASTLTDSGATWGTVRWIGATVEITAGTGSGQTRTISSHTATVLTVSTTWSTNPDSTSKYSIYFGANTTVNPGVGYLERGNTMGKETTTVDAGSNAVSGIGPFTQDFVIAVDAASTTITIKSQFDSNYGSGTKPKLSVLNGGECGVADASDTSTQTAGNWYTHSLTFVPTSAGIVTVRLTAAGNVDSKTVFDTFTKA